MEKRIVILLVVIGVLIMTCANLSAAINLRLFVNNEEIKGDVAPQIVGDRVMVPVRSLAEALGARVDWSADEQKIAITMPDQFEQWDAIFHEGGGMQFFNTEAVHRVNDRYLLIEQGSDVFKGEKYFWLWDRELQQRSGIAWEFAHLESITTEQIIFTVKSGVPSGSLSFPYRYVFDLASGAGRSEPIYLAQDVAFGSGAAWPHNLDAIDVDDNSVHIAFSVPKDYAQVGGDRTPLTTVDYTGDELTLRIYGVQSKEPVVRPFEHPLVTSIEYSWLPEGQPRTDLGILQSDFPYGNQWPRDVGAQTTHPSMMIKIKFAENIRFNIDASGGGHTINFIKKQ